MGTYEGKTEAQWLAEAEAYLSYYRKFGIDSFKEKYEEAKRYAAIAGKDRYSGGGGSGSSSNTDGGRSDSAGDNDNSADGNGNKGGNDGNSNSDNGDNNNKGGNDTDIETPTVNNVETPVENQIVSDGVTVTVLGEGNNFVDLSTGIYGNVKRIV